jgi:hypothetical protein
MANDKMKKSAPAKSTPALPVREKDKQDITFGAPIDTEKIRVTVDGSTIHYLIKKTGEELTKEYPDKDGRNHAVRIIYGRISRDPHGQYAMACIGKIRAAALKHQPI